MNTTTIFNRSKNFKSLKTQFLLAFLIISFSNFTYANVFTYANTISEISLIRNDLTCSRIEDTLLHLSEDHFISELQESLNEEKSLYLNLVMHETWNLRLEINQNLAYLKNCEKSVRQLITLARGIEDLAGFIQSQSPSLTGAQIDFQKQPVPMLENKSFYGYFTKNNRMLNQTLELESGDLLVTRGTSFFSATLSSITENPGDFSHFVLVHKNDQNQKIETLESYAQTGGIARYDLEFALKNENARILLLRPKFKPVAKKGAEYFYQQILAEEKKLKPRTKYDYNLDLTTEDKMTCSEIAYWSYLKASNGTIRIPESKSALPESLGPILDLAKIPRVPMLSPQDMEVDSRFETLAEFKDYRLVQDTRMRNAILRNIFSWVNNKNYKLHQSTKSFLLSYLIHPISRTPIWPMVKGFLNITIPKEAPKGFVRLLYQISDISENIYSKLSPLNSNQMKETGFPMTKPQMDLAIEKIRIDDLAAFENNQKNTFHSYFRESK